MTQRGATVLRRRIEKLYMSVTGEDSVYGAMTWFASMIGVSPKTVWAWCARENPRMPKPPTLLLLRRLERDLPTYQGN